jgi:hypothetical protein
MAYLDNKSIVVDATITKKGRELLAKNGSLKITSFALSDDEIDYGLYNENASSEELKDIALINTPIFEPNTDETQVMKFKLVTLDEGTTFIPTVSIAQESISISSTYTGRIILSPSTSPSNYNVNGGYTAILGNTKVGTLSVTVEAQLSSTVGTITSFAGDTSSESSQAIVGLEFSFIPSLKLSRTTTTTLTIIGNESGGGVTIPVTVTVES